MLVEGLSSLIPSNSVIAAALNIPRSDKTTGVFPNMAPDEVLMPYITLMQVSRSTILSYAGVNRLQSARFRFSCYGPTYRTAKYLAEDLKQLLDGFQGMLSDGTSLENTTPITEIDTSEAAFKATVYATHLDYEFTFLDNIYAVSPPPGTFSNLFTFPGLVTISLAPGAPGNFTVAHGLSVTPLAAFVEMTSGGEIYFQSVKFDATNLYLTASDWNVTGNIVLLVAPEGTPVPNPTESITLTPAMPGNFTVAHGLGRIPSVAVINMTSGGEIYFQTPQYDATYLYLVASDSNVTGVILLW